MNLYMATIAISISAGTLLLTDDQARRRRHVLVNSDADMPDLSDEQLELLGVNLEDKDALGYGLYDLHSTTQFKAGEIFGYLGEINKTMAETLLNVEDLPDEEPDKEQAPEQDLIDAIGKLDSDNPAHFNPNSGKPELKVLKELLDRKVTGAERDAAWEQVQANQESGHQELINAIGNLSADDASHYDPDTGKPVLAALISALGREVTEQQRDKAWEAFQQSQE